MVNTINLI